jgi:hypothetical protein
VTLGSEIIRSLSGAWDLFRRREQGIGNFDVSVAGFWHSVVALALIAPAYVWALSFERGRHLEAALESDVFSASLIELVSFEVVEAWFILPLIAIGIASLLGLRSRLVPFLVALNWTGVLAGLMVVLPPLFWAMGWANEGVAAVYSLAFTLLILQMRWFLAKVVLGVSGGIAGVMVVADAGLELLLAGIII